MSLKTECKKVTIFYQLLFIGWFRKGVVTKNAFARSVVAANLVRMLHGTTSKHN